MNEKGTSILEAALGTMLVTTLLTLGIGVVDLSDQSEIAQEVADRALYETTTKPLRLALNSSGAPEVIINHSAVSAFVAAKAQEAESALLAKLTDLANSNPAYLIELRYGVVSHHETTGAMVGPIAFPAQGRVTRGNLTVPPSVETKTSLQTHIQRVAATTLTGSRSVLAIPSGSFGDTATTAQFIPYSIIVGMRVIVALNPSFTGSLFDEPYALGQKAIVLRGGIGDV